MDPGDYKERHYRNWIKSTGLKTFHIQVKETDLHIQADEDLSAVAYHSVLSCRQNIEAFIAAHPEFLTSLVPLPYDDFAPSIVQDMLRVSMMAGVGPMASVAGAIAERVGRDLLADEQTAEVIVENGGDIFISLNCRAEIAIFAGRSPLSNKIGIALSPAQMPMGVCTSSGTVGPSLSFGLADAVTIAAKSTALADAAATAVGNVVKHRSDIEKGLDLAGRIEGLTAAVIIIKDKIGAWGEIELVSL